MDEHIEMAIYLHRTRSLNFYRRPNFNHPASDYSIWHQDVAEMVLNRGYDLRCDCWLRIHHYHLGPGQPR